jgi:chromosome segregation ATPase
VARLEEATRDLEQRVMTRRTELTQTHARRESLLEAIADGERAVDEDVQAIDRLREDLRAADEAAAALRSAVDSQDVSIKDARRVLEGIRTEVSELDVARATAESDLTHLAQTCLDAVQVSLDEVLAEVEQMEQAGETTPDAQSLAPRSRIRMRRRRARLRSPPPTRSRWRQLRAR